MADLNNQTITPGQEPRIKRDLKQAQRSPTLPSGQKSLAQETNKMGQTQTSQMADQGLAQNLAAGSIQEIGKEVTKQAGKQFTAQILKTAWLNIIDTFGLTLLYINFHFILKYIVGVNAFCEFGQEWAPPIPSQAGKTAGQAATGAVKWAEIILLFVLDILLMLAFFLAIALLLAPIFVAIGIIGAIKNLI